MFICVFEARVIWPYEHLWAIVLSMWAFFSGFEKKIDVFHMVSSTHHPTFPDHPGCYQGTARIAYQSWHSGPYSQLPKALSFEHRFFSNSMGDEKLGLELEDWMIRLLPFGMIRLLPFGIAYVQVLSWNANVPAIFRCNKDRKVAVKMWVTCNSHPDGQLPTRDLSILC